MYVANYLGTFIVSLSGSFYIFKLICWLFSWGIFIFISSLVFPGPIFFGFLLILFLYSILFFFSLFKTIWLNIYFSSLHIYLSSTFLPFWLFFVNLILVNNWKSSRLFHLFSISFNLGYPFIWVLVDDDAWDVQMNYGHLSLKQTIISMYWRSQLKI